MWRRDPTCACREAPTPAASHEVRRTSGSSVAVHSGRAAGSTGSSRGECSDHRAIGETCGTSVGCLRLDPARHRQPCRFAGYRFVVDAERSERSINPGCDTSGESPYDAGSHTCWPFASVTGAGLRALSNQGPACSQNGCRQSSPGDRRWRCRPGPPCAAVAVSPPRSQATGPYSNPSAGAATASVGTQERVGDIEEPAGCIAEVIRNLPAGSSAGRGRRHQRDVAGVGREVVVARGLDRRRIGEQRRIVATANRLGMVGGRLSAALVFIAPSKEDRSESALSSAVNSGIDQSTVSAQPSPHHRDRSSMAKFGDRYGAPSLGPAAAAEIPFISSRCARSASFARLDGDGSTSEPNASSSASPSTGSCTQPDDPSSLAAPLSTTSRTRWSSTERPCVQTGFPSLAQLRRRGKSAASIHRRGWLVPSATARPAPVRCRSRLSAPRAPSRCSVQKECHQSMVLLAEYHRRTHSTREGSTGVWWS